LVNEQTYAAAEVAALSLQAHGEARVFGQPTGGGLSIPRAEHLAGSVTLFFPEALIAPPRGEIAPTRRVEPDQRVANTTAADYRAGRDPQLDAALTYLRARRP